jgi:dihydrodipicolinate synthase/N-acetylneuraminate lyase
MIKKPLSGIIPPLVTPLKDDQHLDFGSLELLVNHLMEGGVHGIFVLGTTGECTSLSYSIRKTLIREVTKQVNGRVPVLVGITDTAPGESLQLAQFSADHGADAAVVAPPYYFGLAQKELVSYFKVMAQSSPLPLFIYNMPSHTKTMISIDTAKAVADHPNVIGFKDSSANGTFFNGLIFAFKDRQDFTLLMGPEEMMAQAVLMGGHGGISGGANMFPKLYVRLFESASKGDLGQVALLQEKVMEISAKIYALGTYGSSYLKGLKGALSLLGLCPNFLASPYNAFDDEAMLKLKQNLDSLSDIPK